MTTESTPLLNSDGHIIGAEFTHYSEGTAFKIATPKVAIQIKLLHSDALKPTYGTDQSAGMDLYATEDVFFRKGETHLIPLGFATSMPAEYHARIESRSGMATKGMVVQTGVIDADYRGEWKVIMLFTGPNAQNNYAETFQIKAGDRVAQAVLRNTYHAHFTVGELDDTQRGSGGFGSTGAR